MGRANEFDASIYVDFSDGTEYMLKASVSLYGGGYSEVEDPTVVCPDTESELGIDFFAWLGDYAGGCGIHPDIALNRLHDELTRDAIAQADYAMSEALEMRADCWEGR